MFVKDWQDTGAVIASGTLPRGCTRKRQDLGVGRAGRHGAENMDGTVRRQMTIKKGTLKSRAKASLQCQSTKRWNGCLGTACRWKKAP